MRKIILSDKMITIEGELSINNEIQVLGDSPPRVYSVSLVVDGVLLTIRGESSIVYKKEEAHDSHGD